MSPKLFNILLVLTPLVLYFGYLSPMYEGVPGFVWTPEASITVLQAQNVQYTNALNQVKLVEDAMNKINKDYTAIDPAVKDKVSLLLPDSVEPIKLRNDVVAIANTSGIALSGLQVSPSVKVKSQNVGLYTVAFTVSAHYSVFKKLIESFEKSTRLFILESIVINRPEKKDDKTGINDSENLNFVVTYSVNYLK
jgi:hypothetical protein